MQGPDRDGISNHFQFKILKFMGFGESLRITERKMLQISP